MLVHVKPTTKQHITHTSRPNEEKKNTNANSRRVQMYLNMCNQDTSFDFCYLLPFAVCFIPKGKRRWKKNIISTWILCRWIIYIVYECWWFLAMKKRNNKYWNGIDWTYLSENAHANITLYTLASVATSKKK